MAPIIAAFYAVPNQINQGDSTTLFWATGLATSVSISGIGNVPVNGARVISPTETTTYILTAVGPTGTKTAETIVNVVVPVPPQYGGEIVFVTASVNPVPENGSSEITTKLQNISNVEAFFDVNIWDPVQGYNWYGGLWLAPGQSFNHSKIISNVTADRQIEVWLWVWDGANWQMAQNKDYLLQVEVIYVPPPVTCTPGEQKCIGPDLYECNASGNNWFLSQSNAGICQTSGGCPDFWLDPMGAVLCWVISGFEALLGLITGGFATLVLNIQNFLDNFGAAAASFLGDIKSGIEDAVGGVVATIGDITSRVGSAITDWWTDTVVTLQRGWDNVVNGVRSWVGDQISTLQRGWDNVVAGVRRWVSDQIQIMQRGWNNVISGIQRFIGEQIAILQRGLDKAIGDITDWFNDQIEIFQRGLTKVSEDITGWTKDQIEILQTGWDKVIGDIKGWTQDQLVIMQRGWDITVSDINILIVNTKKGIEDTIPGTVETILNTLLNLNPIFKFFADLLSKPLGRDPRILENVKKRKEIHDRIKRRIEEL